MNSFEYLYPSIHFDYLFTTTITSRLPLLNEQARRTRRPLAAATSPPVCDYPESAKLPIHRGIVRNECLSAENCGRTLLFVDKGSNLVSSKRNECLLVGLTLTQNPNPNECLLVASLTRLSMPCHNFESERLMAKGTSISLRL